jgi:hypothetical protein
MDSLPTDDKLFWRFVLHHRLTADTQPKMTEELPTS